MLSVQEGRLSRAELTQWQSERLLFLLREVLPRNPFYAEKFAGMDLASFRPEDLERLPFTTKSELCDDQVRHPPYGRNLTYDRTRYCRLHQTSGSSGKPLRWLDTAESWRWMLDCWEIMFHLAGLHPGDRLFFPFSFGPFLGFWTAFEAAWRCGFLSLTGGGMTSLARLRFFQENDATVVLCTPTYAQHLAQVARQEGYDLARSSVRALVVAGEPGGSIPTTRQQMEKDWGARVFDHGGMTEIGPLAIECLEQPAGLHLLESECWPEVIDPQTARPVPPGQEGELVLTNFGRLGSPLIRYRTGDMVCVDPEPCPCGRAFLRLKGGILGRCDDMMHVRGNNFYPSNLEAIVRRFGDVAEYRMEIDTLSTLPALRIELEPTRMELGPHLAERVDRAIREEMLFRAEVVCVAPGTLPRFDMKARRVVHKTSFERQEPSRAS